MKHRCIDFAFLSAWLAAFLAVGCADDLRYRSVFEAGGGDAHISFSVENLSSTRTEDVRSPETDIDHAYLLFYSSEANLTTEAPVAAVRAEIDATNPAALAFKMPLSLLPDTDYRLVALANADVYVPDGYADFSVYVDSWCRKDAGDVNTPLCLYRAERLDPDDASFLPMRGGITGDALFRFTMNNGNYNVSASLLFRRMVARIDVANIVKEGFKVEGVALCNWRDAVAAATPQEELGNRIGTVRGVLTDEGEDTADEIFVAMPDADDNGIQRLTEAIYCFPSVTYASTLSDLESTALIIKAKYGDDAESSYYRVNVGLSGNMAEVKENTKYLVTIQSVTGQGAATPEEAYASEESPIVLSVVQDWDLEGAYSMDDKGNFIVLSTGRMEFEGNAVENREVRVLTSPGLTWSVDYQAGDEASLEAFRASKLNENSFAIGPTGKNSSEPALSGTFVVTAVTPEGATLTVNVAVSQTPGELTPEQPVIPDNMPFALIPESYERVKINHVERTIEIDGFDPSCFNSFIDVPFTVYIKDSSPSSVTIFTSLQWPLEGRVSLGNDKSSLYFYCKDSFLAQGSGQVTDGDNNPVKYNVLGGKSVSARNEEVVLISVGAMGPDDPAITGRTVTLRSGDGVEVEYALTVKPRPCIIDDVVLTDAAGDSWLIQDRNIQDFQGTNYTQFIGLDSDGNKRQAYNYSFVALFTITVPSKFLDGSNMLSESQHQLYRGKITQYNQRNNLIANENVVGSRLYWLKKYSYSEGCNGVSPFYEIGEGNYNYSNWIFPNSDVLELMRSKLKVAKMRMYITSEVNAKAGKNYIPVCCYLPYHCFSIGDSSDDTFGYYISDDGINPNKIVIVYFDNAEAKTFPPQATNSYRGLSRLVRPLTDKELEDYKTNYLGYGSQPHKLTLCHPDTYESTPLGWIQY